MYNGIEHIRSWQEEVNYTQEQVLELLKCSEDIHYFAEKYFHIVTLDRGKVLIELYDFQRDLLDLLTGKSIKDDRYNAIILSARQSSKTTTITIFALWYAMFHKDRVIYVLANKQETAIEILDRVKCAYEMMPYWFQIGVSDYNQKSITFGNRSKIKVAGTSASAIRGRSVNVVVIDEAAFIPGQIADEFEKSVFPTISSVSDKSKRNDAKIILISCVTDDTYIITPEGIKQVSDFVDYTNIPSEILGYEIPEYSIVGKAGINRGHIMVNSGEADTKIIKTTSSSVECSLNHKLWACKSGVYGWFESKDLQVGDYIAIKYGDNCWGNNNSIPIYEGDGIRTTGRFKDYFTTEITEDFAYLLGLYIAEGSANFQKNKDGSKKCVGITISCGDDISEKIKVLGFKYYLDKQKLRYRISSMALVEMMKSLGFNLDTMARNKQIPKKLFEMSRNNIIAMIRGIMDGDGFSCKRDGRVGINCSSKKLVEQIRILLNNFGILSMWTERVIEPNKLVKVKSYRYTIELNKNMSKKYYDTIGFSFERKQVKQKYLPTKLNRDRYDIVPFSKEILLSLKQTNKELYKDIVKTGIFRGAYHKNKHFNRQTMLKYKEIFNSFNNEILQNLCENVDEHIKWESITNIKDSKNKVYDFSLDETGNKWCHSVLYNNIIGHQTPNGLNHFYTKWKKAIHKENDFTPFEVKWDDIPGRGEEFKQDIINSHGQRYWSQEYECVGKDTEIEVETEEGTIEKMSIGELYKWHQHIKNK